MTFDTDMPIPCLRQPLPTAQRCACEAWRLQPAATPRRLLLGFTSPLDAGDLLADAGGGRLVLVGPHCAGPARPGAGDLSGATHRPVPVAPSPSDLGADRTLL